MSIWRTCLTVSNREFRDQRGSVRLEHSSFVSDLCVDRFRSLGEKRMFQVSFGFGSNPTRRNCRSKRELGKRYIRRCLERCGVNGLLKRRLRVQVLEHGVSRWERHGSCQERKRDERERCHTAVEVRKLRKMRKLECVDGSVGENVKFCRVEQGRYLTQNGDVRHGGKLCGKLVDATLEIVRNGLVPCLSSLSRGSEE